MKLGGDRLDSHHERFISTPITSNGRDDPAVDAASSHSSRPQPLPMDTTWRTWSLARTSVSWRSHDAEGRSHSRSGSGGPFWRTSNALPQSPEKSHLFFHFHIFSTNSSIFPYLKEMPQSCFFSLFFLFLLLFFLFFSNIF